eukprot:gene3199-614_t
MQALPRATDTAYHPEPDGLCSDDPEVRLVHVLHLEQNLKGGPTGPVPGDLRAALNYLKRPTVGCQSAIILGNSSLLRTLLRSEEARETPGQLQPDQLQRRVEVKNCLRCAVGDLVAQARHPDPRVAKDVLRTLALVMSTYTALLINLLFRGAERPPATASDRLVVLAHLVREGGLLPNWSPTEVLKSIVFPVLLQQQEHGLPAQELLAVAFLVRQIRSCCNGLVEQCVADFKGEDRALLQNQLLSLPASSPPSVGSAAQACSPAPEHWFPLPHPIRSPTCLRKPSTGGNHHITRSPSATPEQPRLFLPGAPQTPDAETSELARLRASRRVLIQKVGELEAEKENQQKESQALSKRLQKEANSKHKLARKVENQKSLVSHSKVQQKETRAALLGRVEMLQAENARLQAANRNCQQHAHAHSTPRAGPETPPDSAAPELSQQASYAQNHLVPHLEASLDTMRHEVVCLQRAREAEAERTEHIQAENQRLMASQRSLQERLDKKAEECRGQELQLNKALSKVRHQVNRIQDSRQASESRRVQVADLELACQAQQRLIQQLQEQLSAKNTPQRSPSSRCSESNAWTRSTPPTPGTADKSMRAHLEHLRSVSSSEEFTYVCRLGATAKGHEGNDAAVMLVKPRHPDHKDRYLVLKIMLHQEMYPRSHHLLTQFRKEFAILTECLPPSPYIIPVYHHFTGTVPDSLLESYPMKGLSHDKASLPKTLFLVMPRMLCSLAALLDAYRTKTQTHELPETFILWVAVQLLKAVEVLQRSSVAHRDIKEDNLLVNLPTELLETCDGHQPILPFDPLLIQTSPLAFQIHLTDFGHASDALIVPYPSASADRGGARFYQPPEVMDMEPGPSATLNYHHSDLYSVGLVMLGMCMPCPYKQPSRMKLHHVTEMQFPAMYSVNLINTIRSFLHPKPDGRPAVSTAIFKITGMLFGPSLNEFKNWHAQESPPLDLGVSTATSDLSGINYSRTPVKQTTMASLLQSSPLPPRTPHEQAILFAHEWIDSRRSSAGLSLDGSFLRRQALDLWVFPFANLERPWSVFMEFLACATPRLLVSWLTTMDTEQSSLLDRDWQALPGQPGALGLGNSILTSPPPSFTGTLAMNHHGEIYSTQEMYKTPSPSRHQPEISGNPNLDDYELMSTSQIFTPFSDSNRPISPD